MADVSISVIDTASPMLVALAAGVSDFRKPLNTAGLYLTGKSFMEQFRSEGEPSWKPLQPETIARRRKGRGRGQPKILQDTGRLRRSYTSSVAPNSIHDLQHYKLTVGSNLVYAAFHQFGFPPRNIPERPLIIRPRDISTIQLIFQRWLLRQAGRR